MEEQTIMGIQVNKTMGTGPALQSVLSKYGCVIKTRLGLNKVEENYATAEGIILLELSGDPAECQRLENDLLKMDNLSIQKMVFPKI